MSKAKKDKNQPNPEVGRRLKEAIQSKGFTQSEIARKLDYSNNAISNLVNGYNRLTPETAKKIGDILGFSAEYLLCESDYPTSHWKSLAKDINEKNIELGYYNQFFSSDIIIMYDDSIEAFRLTNKKNKSIRYATKQQLDDYCKYVQMQNNAAETLMWDLLERQEIGTKRAIQTKIEHGINPETGERFTKHFYLDNGVWKEGDSMI